MYAVAPGEAFDEIVAVLPDAHYQIRRDADVERAVVVAGKEVDAGLFHAPSMEAGLASWVPAFAGMTGRKRLRGSVRKVRRPSGKTVTALPKARESRSSDRVAALLHPRLCIFAGFVFDQVAYDLALVMLRRSS